MIASAVFVGMVTLVISGPVQVRIETGNQSDFNIGSGPRQTFELIEEYRPLSMAFNPKISSRILPNSTAVPPTKIPQNTPLPSSEASNIHIINVDGVDVKIIDTPIENLASNPIDCEDYGTHFVLMMRRSTVPPPVSKWSEWSFWGPCQDGVHRRSRTCIAINKVPCLGESTETFKCRNFMHSDILFAKDPMVIEKEILGMDTVDVIA